MRKQFVSYTLKIYITPERMINLEGYYVHMISRLILVTGCRFTVVFLSASVRQLKWTVSQGHVIGEEGEQVETAKKPHSDWLL